MVIEHNRVRVTCGLDDYERPTIETIPAIGHDFLARL